MKLNLKLKPKPVGPNDNYISHNNSMIQQAPSQSLQQQLHHQDPYDNSVMTESMAVRNGQGKLYSRKSEGHDSKLMSSAEHDLLDVTDQHRGEAADFFGSI